MSFMDHLMELRRRLWASLLAVALCIVLALVFYDEIFAFLRLPLDRINDQYRANPQEFHAMLRQLDLPPTTPSLVPIISTSPLATMTMIMWLGVGAGLILSSPILVFELWSFIGPGLKEIEKRAIRPVLLGGVFFFVLGCAIAYYILAPVTLAFLVWFDVSLKIRPYYTVDDYMSLIINMLAITGLICEIPLVIAGLARMGLVKPAHLTQYWRICLLTAFILGSIFSPGSDVISMLIFSALLLGIYLVSVLFAFIFYRGEAAGRRAGP